MKIRGTATAFLAIVLFLVGSLATGQGPCSHWPPALARLGRVWVHQNWPHLGGNVLALLVVGSALESATGAGFVLGVWLLAGVLGTEASGWLHPDRLSLGASGAVYGLVGALLVTLWRQPSPEPRRLVTIATLLALIGSGLQATKLGLPVDRANHLAGALTGMLLAATRPKAGHCLLGP